MNPKISIIGAGQVGGTAAHLLFQKNLGDIVLLDIVEGIPQGKALDIMQSGAIEGCRVKVRSFGSTLAPPYKEGRASTAEVVSPGMPGALAAVKIKGTNNYEHIKDSDIILITAGFPRKPGMDRLDLLKKNADIVKEAVKNAVSYCPNGIIIIMTNPVDALAYYAWKISGFTPNRVIGQAGVLDTARFIYFISQELDVPSTDIKTMVLGGHGNTMVPLPRLTTIKGKSLTEIISKEKIEYLIEKTRNGGAEIVNLFKTGSAYYAPAASAVSMIEAIIKDKKEIMPVSVYLNGEYGIKDVYIGVPAILGKNGIEKIEELKLTEEELTALQKSADIYKESIKELKI